MRSFAGFLYDHRRIVIVIWLAVLVSLIGIGRAVGPDYQFDINISGSESVDAFKILDEHQPGPSGDTITVAWEAPGKVNDPQTIAHVSGVLDELADVPNVASVVNPYTAGPLGAVQLSPAGSVGFATVQLDEDSLSIPKESVEQIIQTVKDGNTDSITMGVGGQAVASRGSPQGTHSAEAIGMAAAAVILVAAFGAVLAAALPLIAALIALGASLSVVTLLTHWMSIPVFAPQLVALIGIGVGIDYALFVVSRHRTGLMRGKEPREAMLDAMDSSGRAVVFAGITVMISLLGLLVAQIGFLNGLAISASVGVLFTMIVTVTLLPAMLGFLGMRVLGRKALKDLRENGPHDDERSTKWGAWAGMIQRRPWPFIAVSALILAVLSLPALGLNLGSADAGTDPQGSTTRIAYDLVSEGFGPGTNGPLILVTAEDEADALKDVADDVAAHPNVASVSPPVTTPDGEVGIMQVIPKTSPQDTATSDLIADLRENVLPQASSSPVYVTGVTAVFDDFAADLQAKLPWFLIGVLGLSSLLLMVAFRSIAIPVKAAVMNLAAAAASFGVLVAVFQWGWFADAIGVETGPIDAFLPIMLLAILFGLSMDYQVFLVSRMREEWVRRQDNAVAVRLGLAETGRVITAAALIMIVVFAAFVFGGGDRIIKMFGLGLAVAIFLDAFLIRSLLVPALMQVLGNWNWWIPAWLDRALPNITIEPTHTDENEDELPDELAGISGDGKAPTTGT